MGNKDQRVDAYIENAAEFARPILRYLREVVHEGCPECVEEIKWRSPSFSYKGLLAGMAAFREHCTFGYWKGALVIDEGARSDAAMGQLGRITAIADLPSRATLLKWTRKAASLNEAGVKVKRAPKTTQTLRIPADLAASLRKNRKALAIYESFSPTKRRDYIEWILEAKTAATRKNRVGTAVQWMAAGKSRNWKYEKTGR